ncbi:Os09g0315700 [Oryza sativa Japonica Group]|uniref:Os09g0315700 protein n=1 Tax=Oryza sativa subsp. japonica TaxID=39947 RepID=Q0J2Q4_ORYSJ|nr:Os09g0315700 [Oryza sativa Japonica Group]|eukprot:NP_001062847.2 Os09g0315700 [Oryza sativa Japonica Group]
MHSKFQMTFTGNPRVTPEVTRDVCLLARMMAANLYCSQIEDLMFEVQFDLTILKYSNYYAYDCWILIKL